MASRWKRPMQSGSPKNSSGRILRAISRLSLLSRARYSPMLALAKERGDLVRAELLPNRDRHESGATIANLFKEVAGLTVPFRFRSKKEETRLAFIPE